MKPLLVTSLLARGALLLAAATVALGCSSSDPEKNDACTPDDADGIIDEPANPVLTVTDSEFMPKIITTQNSSTVTLTFKNQGTKPHGFVVDCLPTPNRDGCPMESCFPTEAKIEPIQPGEEVQISFETPLVEGIYPFHSDLAGHSELEPGQFIIQ